MGVVDSQHKSRGRELGDSAILRSHRGAAEIPQYPLLVFGLPLGIEYFVFLVTGFSVGFGLVVIWVGVPISMMVLLGSWAV
ncbi:MAG: hypothetical protein FI737_04525 [SAR202 cluster bacterium]|nr:hypothetical protein [SAR202 cluster bacterium]